LVTQHTHYFLNQAIGTYLIAVLTDNFLYVSRVIFPHFEELKVE